MPKEKRTGNHGKFFIGCFLFLGSALYTISAQAQTDPGPRTWPGGNVPYITNLDPVLAHRATDGRATMDQEWTVTKGNPISPFYGLQTFDATSCTACHGQPTTGGGSPATNQQIAAATAHGANANTVPSFLTSTTAAIAPFCKNSQTVGAFSCAAGQLIELFVPNGRTDAGACSLTQPPFSTLVSSSNIVLRQAIPFWRDGLVEATPLASLVAQQASNAGSRTGTGQVGAGIILGRFNSVGGFPGIVGWKGDLISLRTRNDLAMSKELGVTNGTYPRKLNEPNGGSISNDCSPNPQTEDFGSDTVWGLPQLAFGFDSWHMKLGDLLYAYEVSVDAPPQICTPASGSGATCYTSSAAGMPNGGVVTAGQVYTGQQQFVAVGCDICHTPTQTAGSSIAGGTIAGRVYGLGSDKALHHMGSTLADGITAGSATGDDFVTPKLIGTQYTKYFMSNGGYTDLQGAILAHSQSGTVGSGGSEANASVAAYQALSTTLQQDILDYLRNGPFQ